MTKVLITQDKLDTLAEVIGGKSNTNVPLTVDEMITAADSITSGGASPTLETVTKTYTPSTSAVTDTITPGAGYDGIEEVDVIVSAVPLATIGDSDVVGSYSTVNGNRKWTARGYFDYNTGGYVSGVNYTDGRTYNAIPTGTTVTPSTSSQTIGGAGYMMEGAVTVSAMPSGTAGTPTATKGAVSNHSVSVTPSVTNTTGYITGSTKTGTAVTVSASELVSGSETKTANGTYDVTNLASLVVNVSGGSSKNAQVVQGTTRTTSSTLTAIGAEMTVSKTGTYNVYWSAFRSNTSSQYTFATKLYINGTGYGSEQTTWSNHQQNVHLSNVSLSANDKIRVYGRESRGSSYYMYAGTLTIIEA